uniref:glycerophosphodiester phosphodiesterase n=1 Tax=Setaria italica TaxID=4555 RepID=A0A0Q3R3E4_SETIT
MEAFRMALDARVDCMEVDVSRSSDGVLFALHDSCSNPGGSPIKHTVIAMSPDGPGSKDDKRVKAFAHITIHIILRSRPPVIQRYISWLRSKGRETCILQDGLLICRDLQKMSGNSTAKVGHWSTDEIKALRFQLSKRVQNEEVPKAEDALAVISRSVRQVILDVKVGPPSFDKGLAEDVLSLLKRTNCKNCLVWAKTDNLARDIIKLSEDVVVGYIVMVDKSTGRKTEFVRLEGAKVAGVYHPLIHEKVVKVMRRHGKKVFAWTVDDNKSMEKMLHEHVDAIVTSNPSLLQQLMHETRTECLEDGFALP